MKPLKEISTYYRNVFLFQRKTDTRTEKHISFELGGIALTAALKFIMMDWLNMKAFYITGICLFWIGYILFRYFNHKAILTEWGFSLEGFRETIIFLLPFLLLCCGSSLILALNNNVSIINWRILPILFMYPLWGLFQQYIMIILIYGNIVELERVNLSRQGAIAITALLFSIVHYPSFFLMIFVFVMEILFLIAWSRWKNLLALGLIHGIIGTVILYFINGRHLWLELFEWFN